MAEHDAIDGEPDVAAHAPRHDVVVPGQHDDADAMALQGGDGLRGRRLGRIEEGHEAGQDEIALVADAVRRLLRRERLRGHGHDTKAFFVQAADQGERRLPPRGREFDDVGAELRRRAHRQHLFDRALADHDVARVAVRHDDRHPATREVERDLIDFRVVLQHVEFVGQLDVLEHRPIEEVLEARLVVAVQVGQFEDAQIGPARQIQVLLEHDLVLRQRAGLVGAEDVHRPQVLDRVQPLDDHLVPRHRDRATRQVGRDDHREHFRREAHGDGDRKEEGLFPVALDEPVQQEDDRDHDQHEPDQHPGHAVDALVEAGQGALIHDALRQRSELRARTGEEHQRRRRAADEIRAHETERRREPARSPRPGDPDGSCSSFSTGSDSPVSADWLTNTSFADRRRTSAGTMSPADKCTMSPGTRSSNGTSHRWPSRLTVAVVSTMLRSVSAAFEDRYS